MSKEIKNKFRKATLNFVLWNWHCWGQRSYVEGTNKLSQCKIVVIWWYMWFDSTIKEEKRLYAIWLYICWFKILFMYLTNISYQQFNLSKLWLKFFKSLSYFLKMIKYVSNFCTLPVYFYRPKYKTRDSVQVLKYMLSMRFF